MTWKLRIALLTVLGLALMVAPAGAQVLYEERSHQRHHRCLDHQTSAYVVSDSFTLTSDATITSLEFGMWLSPGDVLESVEVSVTSQRMAGKCFSTRC